MHSFALPASTEPVHTLPESLLLIDWREIVSQSFIPGGTLNYLYLLEPLNSFTIIAC